MRLPINLFPAAAARLPRPVSISSSTIHPRQSHYPTPQSSPSGRHPPFVWHDDATPDDKRRISEDLSYFSRILSDAQQHTLLKAALDRLDHVGSHASRSRRKRTAHLLGRSTDTSLSGTFLPDEYYDFEHAHFDQVIVKFRETRIAQDQWPNQDNVLPILNQITSLLPPVPLQTHLLHLATDGHILPHIDNTEASGSFILGLSLGAPRILRLERINPVPSQDANHKLVCDLLLEPGSVYIQKDYIRYNMKHSILLEGTIGGVFVPRGQRLSIMMRDMPSVEKSSLH